jgi:hypothetical protein
MSQVLGMFGLLDFTMLWPILAWMHFETYELFISLIFKILGGLSKLQITETVYTESADMGARLYSGTSVHEFNSFLEAVRHPKCS